MNTDHLIALQNRLANEKARHAAKSETEWFKTYIAGIEKEIAGEYKFLGMTPTSELPEMSDDELMNELMK